MTRALCRRFGSTASRKGVEMIHIHELGGCAPAPLAHYLKALGGLRLVADQADDNVRGWWEVDRFRLASKLSREELEEFFLRDYQPTPMFNPRGLVLDISKAVQKRVRDLT